MAGEQKLIVLGNQGVGKTALMTRLVHNVFEDSYTSTIGMDLFTKTMMLGKTSYFYSAYKIEEK